MSDLCNEINLLGKGLSNPSRYRILEALFDGPKTVSQLTSIVKLTQPAVSQHLATLKASQLVMDERKGQEVFYTLNAAHTVALLKKLSGALLQGKNN